MQLPGLDNLYGYDSSSTAKPNDVQRRGPVFMHTQLSWRGLNVTAINLPSERNKPTPIGMWNFENNVPGPWIYVILKLLSLFEGH